MSLLDEAKKVPIRKKNTMWHKEHFELTKAWLNDEVSLLQIANVISPKGKIIYQNKAANMVMYCLRSMRRDGLIKMIEKK